MNGRFAPLAVQVFATPEDAIKADCVYHEGYMSLTLRRAVIVQKGTVEGNATVDLILEDNKGNKYIAITSARLLKALPL